MPFAPRLRAAALAAALAVSYAAPAGAQSLFAYRGLGLPVEPQDPRSGSLGGVALGQPVAEISWHNPAGAVGLPAAGLQVSFQLDDFDATYAGRSSTGSTARFPMIMGAFPFGERWALTAGFGGYLDQNWALEQPDTLLIGPDSVAVVDRFSSEGAISRFRLGAGYRVVPGLSVGLGVELFTGNTRRVAGRVFPNELQPRCCSAEWRYSGRGYLASVDWNPREALSLSASASTGGTLSAEVRSGQASTGEEYDLPVQLNAGATARVAPTLLVALGTEWGGWSSLNGALAESGGARDTWTVQGGVEWDALRVGDRPVPLRLGARNRALPFRWVGSGSEWASERAVTGGTGVVLGGGAARADLSVERGTRGGSAVGLEESYWRVLVGVTVLGR